LSLDCKARMLELVWLRVMLLALELLDAASWPGANASFGGYMLDWSVDGVAVNVGTISMGCGGLVNCKVFAFHISTS